jgi:hypothetical protein
MSIIRKHLDVVDNYTIVPNDWARDESLSFQAIGLLTQLLSHRDGWEVSVRSLAGKHRAGRDAIRSMVAELETAGYLKRVQNRHEATQRFSETIWETQDPRSGEPLTGKPSTAQPAPAHPATKKTIYQEDQEQENQSHPQAELEGAFIEFWSLYPRKVEKLAARKAFGKAVAAVGVDEVLAGVKRLAADRNLPPKQYIPYPASWLNAGGWESEPYPERELSAEEKAERARAEYERKRLAEREHSQRLLAESEEARRKATPPPKCEHGNTITRCRECLRSSLN